VSVLLEALGEANPDLRSKAAWELASAGDGTPEIVAALERALDDPDRNVRYAAAWSLSHLAGADAKAATSRSYDTSPKVIHQSSPVYPHGPFLARIQGTVGIEILIGEEGEVAFAGVRESIAGLDQAALRCVAGWKFFPATKAGKAVAILAQAPVTFRITK